MQKPGLDVLPVIAMAIYCQSWTDRAGWQTGGRDGRNMDSIVVFLQLAGAVALLLFGLGLVRDGMVEAFGLKMKMILGAGTRTGPRAFVSGVVATLGLQSSTATALLTASFVHREMIGIRMAQIVLLGANVGTALTAVIVSADIAAAVPVLVLAGYVLRRRGGTVGTGIGAGLISVALMISGADFRA